MRPLQPFRAVICDMDGLLIDSERIARKAWLLAINDFGYEISPDDYLQVIGRTLADTEQTFKRLLGDAFPFTDVRQLRLQHGQADIDANGLPTRPGATELLTFLRQADCPRAVATSTQKRDALDRLRLTGLADYFDIVCGGEEVTKGKPAPDLFLLAAERLGVPPQDCVVLEDSDYGIRAAHAAGMTPLWVPDLKPTTDEISALAHGVYPSLHDVKAAMEAIWQD